VFKVGEIVKIDKDEMEESGVGYLEIDYQHDFKIISKEDYQGDVELQYYQLMDNVTEETVMLNETYPYSFIEAEMRKAR
jgi:hypothetical protein